MQEQSNSQDWTTVCNYMPERDGKDQGEDTPKQACSCWFACHSWSAISSGANLYPLRAFFFFFADRCHADFLRLYFCFVLFNFRLFAFIEATALRAIVLRYTCAPTATRTQLPNSCLCPFLFLFIFCFFGDVAFPLCPECKCFAVRHSGYMQDGLRGRRVIYPCL